MHSIKIHKDELIEEFLKNRHTERFTKNLSKVVDRELISTWQAFGLDHEKHVALIAVGGYGRGELFPYSDVDILILTQHSVSEDESSALNQKIEQFISKCWDLGIEIGSSVRSVDECIEESNKDITIKTTLLEARFITGEKKLFERFSQAYLEHLDAQQFFQAKWAELKQRHHKYQDSPYSLEPNCKESPGGLRDLQVILWLTKAAHLGKSFNDLYSSGLLTKRELLQIKKNLKFLELLRAQLHCLTHRRQDILAFDLQNQLAQSLGFESEGNLRASEKLMKNYYWAAKAVSQLRDILILNIQALLFPNTDVVGTQIDEYFVEKQGLLEITDPNLFEKNPNQILRSFLYYAKYPSISGFSVNLLRGLYNARNSMNVAWRKDPLNRRCFMEIIKQPRGITHAFRLMNQTSVLGRYLPAFRKIVGQMQHDLFHVYTVDQHILMVLRNIRRFWIIEHNHEFPFCSELASGFDKPWLMILAALFHDIAKGRGGDHSELGKRDARQFAKDHGMDKKDTDLLVWLVENHLYMSQVAQKQDISDPEVISRFAKHVANKERLTALYLLTVADIRGTSPKVWNAWKGKLLEDLYRLTSRSLGGEIQTVDSEISLKKDEAQKILRLYGLDEQSHMTFWKELDSAFFIRHPASDIAWLSRHLYHKVHTNDVIVKARLSPVGEGLQVFVYLKDQVDLFARICAYFDQGGFSILDAKIHTTYHGYALDTFQISGTSLLGEDGSYRDIIQLVEYELAHYLQNQTPLQDISKGRLSRLSRSFPMQPRVNLKPDEKGQYFVLSISTHDRSGLLYGVAKILAKHKISLHTARINTLGERVEDVFLLATSQGLRNPKNQVLLETELLADLSA